MCLFGAEGVILTGMSATAAAAANMAIAALVSTTASLTQQQANQRAMSKHQERVYDTQKKVALAQALSGYSAKQAEQMQQEGAFAAASLSSYRKAGQARAVATVMSAEGGVEGGSVGEMLNEITKSESEYQMALLERRKYEDMAYLRSTEAIQLGQYQAGLNALPQPVPEPDYLGAILGVGADAYGGYLTAKYS
jgi:hypothetical protein